MRLRTERLEIVGQAVARPAEVGGQLRLVYTAWMHTEDVPYPVCVLTVWPATNWVEWIDVPVHWRRQGIAREVVRAVEGTMGHLEMTGATAEGVCFVNHMTEGRDDS